MKITIKREQIKTRFGLPGARNLRNAGAKKILYSLMALAAVTFAGCDVTDEIVDATYKLTVTADANGTAKATVDGADAANAIEGATVTVTATPETGYRFKEWTVQSGGITLSPNATAPTATFTMPARAVSVMAGFELIPVFNVSPDTDQSVAADVTSFTFTVTSNTPWKCLVDGAMQDEGTGDKAVTITFPANTSPTDPAQMKVEFTTVGLTPEITYDITITQTQVPIYDVTVSSAGNGEASASVDGQPAGTAKAGDMVTLTAVADPGYKFKQWTVLGGSITLSPDANTSPATFTMPAEAVSVRAEFELIPVLNVSPDTDQSVAANVMSFDFTVTSNTPWECYVDDVKRDEGTGDKVVTVGFPANTSTTDPVEIKVRFTTVSLPTEIVREITITQAAVPLYPITLTHDGNGTTEALINNQPVTAAKAGDKLIIRATSTNPGDYEFKQWVVVNGGDIKFSPDAYDRSAVITMPAEEVEIRAEFRPTQTYLNSLANAVTVTFASGSTATEATYVFSNIPQNGKVHVYEVRSGGNPVTFTQAEDNAPLIIPAPNASSEIGPNIDIKFYLTLDVYSSDLRIRNVKYTGVSKNYVGGVYYKDGTAQGVVYIPNTGPGTGRMVSLAEENTSHDAKYGVAWGPTTTTTEATDRYDGRPNMQKIAALNDWASYPAFSWVHNLNAPGANYSNSTGIWYLPSYKELLGFCNTMKNYGVDAFNTILTTAGGTVISFEDYPYYWSSTEESLLPTHAAVVVSYANSVDCTKDDINRVRAFMAF